MMSTDPASDHPFIIYPHIISYICSAPIED